MSRFDSVNMSAPHTLRELDMIENSAPTADKMLESVLRRASVQVDVFSYRGRDAIRFGGDVFVKVDVE